MFNSKPLRTSLYILKELRPLDLITIAYVTITAFYVAICTNDQSSAIPHYIIHFSIVVFIFFIIWLQSRYEENKYIDPVRSFYPLALIMYLYGETDYMNNFLFGYQDLFFSHLEQSIFGCQPSLEFSKIFPQPWINELMHFGYFSYFILIFVVCLVIYNRDKRAANEAIFIILMSFYAYYFIFIILPVKGPEYYFFKPPHFVSENGYFFTRLLNFTQACGEKPTGAFPSSHVGVAMMLLYISWKNSKKLFFSILPVIIILCIATIYIKAHYVIDIIAGFLSFPLLTWASIKVYRYLLRFNLSFLSMDLVRRVDYIFFIHGLSRKDHEMIRHKYLISSQKKHDRQSQPAKTSYNRGK
jgi:membrane-associated phospholipid phosphatase